MKKFQFICVALLAIVITGCANTTSRLHPALHEELKQIKSVAILPPAVTVELVTLTGENERMTEKEQELSAQLIAIAKARLSESGYDVASINLDEVIESDEEIAYAVTQLQEGFVQAKKDLEFGKPLSAEKSRQVKTSVGEAASILQSVSGADAILMINYTGFDKSGGHVAKDIATGVLVGVLTMGAVVPVAPKSFAITEIALLHGLSGEVLWADTVGGPLNESIGRNALNTLPKDVGRLTVDRESTSLNQATGIPATETILSNNNAATSHK